MKRRYTKRRSGWIAAMCALVLLVGACSGDDDLEDDFRSNGGGPGNPSSGNNSGTPNNDSGDFDDPYEGLYEITYAAEDIDGCSASGADDFEPMTPFLLLVYENLEDFGYSYVAYACDSEAEEDCDIQPWYIFPDVDVADASELPEVDDRALGELGVIHKDARWENTEGRCYAILEEDDLELEDGSIAFTTVARRAYAHEILTADECDIDAAHEHVHEGDFSCHAATFFEADKIKSLVE